MDAQDSLQSFLMHKDSKVFVAPPLPPPLFSDLPGTSRSLPCSRPGSVTSAHSDVCSPLQHEDQFSRPCVDVSKLPPIGVFWDIENCQVPKGRSAVAVAQAIRERFFTGFREAEFLVVCDVTKESLRVVQDLNNAHVSLMHVAATCKNAADDKLRQSIRKFADIHASPAAVILISGDVNFAADLIDLRHKKKFHVILLHNVNVSEVLVLSASEHHNFSQLVDSLPTRSFVKVVPPAMVTVVIYNLPEDKDPSKVKYRLKQLCENSGGRVGFVSSTSCAIRFPSLEFACRAQKRMDGEDVFGNKIVVSDPFWMDEWQCPGKPRRDSSKTKDDLEFCQRVQKKDSNLQFNNLSQLSYSQMLSMGAGSIRGDGGTQVAVEDFTKSSVPYFSNNISHFIFPKVPNVENLKLSISGQSEQSKAIDKPYFNNLEVPTSLAPGHPSNRSNSNTPGKYCRNKFTNILANQLMDGSQFRMNNYESLDRISQYSMGYEKHMLAMKHTSQDQLASPGGCALQTDLPEDYLDDTFFQPIQNGLDQSSSNPVELHVSGLDPFLDLLVTKNLLVNLFKLHVEVLNVAVFCLTDGNVVASVKVASLQDAQYAISQLQRCHVGTRRINIAFQNITPHQRELLRSQVMQLLSEMPNSKIPLFLFRERFKARFLTTVSVSELSRMKDICTISEDKAGRVITANSPVARQLPSTPSGQEKDPYCQLHTKKAWSQTEPPVLPFIRIGLMTLSARITKLMSLHEGRLPLPSLADCYQAQFGPLPTDPQGVPMEHLVSCIPGVEVVQSRSTFKYLTFSTGPASVEEVAVKCVSPLLIAPVSALAKKLVELVQEAPRSIIEFSQFIPSYHRHYGRQCRVSDYGFTKLLDLLESMPHVIQVIGHGSYRKVTLSHKAQVRRFTADLLRLLKQKNNKQVDLDEFPAHMEAVTHRTWDPCDYGLCELTDLIDCLPPNTVQLRPDKRTLVAVAVREQTAEEVELTKQFAKEVVQLLKRVPSCSMTFNKFVPAYHNHFGRQCRVTSYGFVKLVDLFEAIPQTVYLEEDSSRGEKMVVLTQEEQTKVVGERVAAIVTSQGGAVLLSRLDKLYEWHNCGCMLAPEDFGCDSLEQLLAKISDQVKLECSPHGLTIVSNAATDPVLLTHRTRAVLAYTDENSMSTDQFVATYKERFNHDISVSTLAAKIPHVVQLVAGDIRLTPLSVFANHVTALLVECGGRLPLPSFESAYQAKFLGPCHPDQFGCSTLSDLISSIPEVVSLQDHDHLASGRLLLLNPQLKAMLPQSADLSNHSYDMWKSKLLFPHPLPIPPHPSELPLPSATLASPLCVRSILPDSLAEATSTTDDDTARGDASFRWKRTSRLAAHFDNLTNV